MIVVVVAAAVASFVAGYFLALALCARADEADRPKTLDDAWCKFAAARGSQARCCALDCAEDRGAKVNVVGKPGRGLVVSLRWPESGGK